MKTKYRNKPIVVDGLRFDSQREYRRWVDLQHLQRAGKISDLERQVKYTLIPSVKFNDAARAQPAVRMILDFRYREAGAVVLEDVKSKPTLTQAFRIKRHLLLAQTGQQVKVTM